MKPRMAALFIAGFGQGLTEPTGTERMFVDANRKHGDKSGVIIVRPYQWHHDWKAEAAFLQRQFCTGEAFDDLKRTRVVVVAYSWGAGWGFQRLSRALLSRGVYIDKAILIDPVYRWPHLPTALWWLSISAMTTLGRVHIARNVREVWYYRQFRNRPRGRECVPVDPYFTTIHPPTELECRHRHADKHPEVQQKVAEVIEAMVESQGTGK